MLRLLAVLLRVLASAARSRCALLVENLALRQQLATVLASGARPRIRPADRAFWLLLRRVWARSADVLVIVEPDTVARWHREGFRIFWRWRSRRRTGRPSTARQLRALIRRMAFENSWGAPRIHGELVRLGIVVSERTVSRHLAGLVRFPERHLHRLVRDDVAYYGADRTHLGLRKDSPAGRRIELRPGPSATIAAMPRVGGLHHRYPWRAAP